jgi:hypothetical protein
MMPGDLLATSATGFLFPGKPFGPPHLIGVISLAILAIAAVLVAGSRRRVPAPFGPAANGVVAYAKNGVIYTADPVTGKDDWGQVRANDT